MAIYRRTFFNFEDPVQKPAPVPKVEISPVEAQYRFLGSGEKLPVDESGKPILRPGQQLLFIALCWNCHMPAKLALRYIGQLDRVPCEVLDIVAEQIEETHSPLARRFQEPSFETLAKRCIAATTVSQDIMRTVWRRGNWKLKRSKPTQ